MADTTLLNEVTRVSEAAGYLKTALIAKGFPINDAGTIDHWAEIVTNYEREEEENVTPFKVTLQWGNHYSNGMDDMPMMGQENIYNKYFMYTTTKDMTKFEGHYGANNIPYTDPSNPSNTGMKKMPTIYEATISGDTVYENDNITGFAIGPWVNYSYKYTPEGWDEETDGTYYNTPEPMTSMKIEGGKNLLSTAQMLYGINKYFAEIWDESTETLKEYVTYPTIDISGLYTRNVINMYGMFNNGASWAENNNVNIVIGDGFDTRNVICMKEMFKGWRLPFDSKFKIMDTSKVVDMNSMFYFAGDGTNVKLSYDTSKVKDFWGMFFYCQFSGLDLTSFDTTAAEDMGGMFYQSSSVTSFKVSNKFFNASADKISTYDFSGLTNWTNSTELSDFVGILPDGNGRTLNFSTNTKSAMTSAGLISTIEGKGWTVA